MSERFSWNRAKAIARKEAFHILRDPYTITLALFMPLFMVFVYGFAIDFNVKNVPMAVSNFDHSQYSRELIDTFRSSNYFIIRNVNAPDDVLDDIESERTRAGLIIPPKFSTDLNNGRNAVVQIVLDGADNSTVGAIAGYMNGIQLKAVERLTNFKVDLPFKLKTRFLFNPELNSRWFIIPGLIVIVMTILSVLLTALTIAREWENGSMELLLSTPIKPIEIIIGKLAPYAVLGFIALLLIFLFSSYVFHVPFKGSMTLFLVCYLIFLTAYLAHGLLISILTKNQQTALQYAMLTGFLPAQLLSGFIFPIASMPIFFHYFTMIFPARWFVYISRNIFLKNTKFVDMWFEIGLMTILSIGIVLFATNRFKRSLEK
jgi:ABC-2 type transport system permease protein